MNFDNIAKLLDTITKVIDNSYHTHYHTCAAKWCLKKQQLIALSYLEALLDYYSSGITK